MLEGLFAAEEEIANAPVVLDPSGAKRKRELPISLLIHTLTCCSQRRRGSRDRNVRPFSEGRQPLAGGSKPRILRNQPADIPLAQLAASSPNPETASSAGNPSPGAGASLGLFDPTSPSQQGVFDFLAPVPAHQAELDMFVNGSRDESYAAGLGQLFSSDFGQLSDLLQDYETMQNVEQL